MQHSGNRASAGGRSTARVLTWLILLAWAACAPPLHAQWITQTNALRAGWNAVFLHVDASHTTLDELVGSDPTHPIEEIWSWFPTLPTGQFVESPQLPTDTGSQWSTWTRESGPGSALQRLNGNGAFLVRVADNVPSFTWRVTGRPVTPTHRWTLTGLNFIGFPAPVTPPPSFESFLAPAPGLQQSAEVYRYQGGELGATNPVRVFAFRTTPLRRDQAYWVRAGESYNQYFGPIQVDQADPAGLRFGDTAGQKRLRLRNLANAPVTVTLRQVDSEPAPAGQPALQGPPPLLLRGPLNTTNLTFGHSTLAAGPQTWNLAAAGQAGSEVEIVLGLNRSQMTGAPGDLFAGILRFTDSLGLSQIDMAVSAVKETTAGLWVGAAEAAYVSHYLKPYATATNEAALGALLGRLQLGEGIDGYHYERDPLTGRVLVFGGPDQRTGSYLLDGPIKIDSGSVARPYPLRLIVHHDGATARLLQQVFHGTGPGSNMVLTTREQVLLPGTLGDARRISSVHFPPSEGNVPWNFSGSMQPGGALTTTVALAHDDHASNPFLHTYHPDHDNLDARFQTSLARGLESHGITRQLTLDFRAPEDDFNSLTRGGQDLAGDYAEVITIESRGSQARQFNVLGTFALRRVSDIATLTTP